MKGTSILVVGDERIPRDALRGMLARHRELRILGECDTRAAEGEVGKLNPQVVILDVPVPGAVAQQLIEKLHRGPGVVVLSRESQEPYVRACFAAGALAYILVRGDPADLLAAIRAAAAQRQFLDPLLSEILSHTFLHDQRLAEILSARERQVLTMLAYGHTNRQIAEQLSLSTKSVDTYRQRISTKLNLRTRADMVRYSISMGLMRVADFDLKIASS